LSSRYEFRPYVSVAQRRRFAEREMQKKRAKGLNVQPVVINGRVIAKTFWGKAWCENLESYSDFENRLPRGRTYARNGSVVHLEIRNGKISAFVAGSELYSVEITIASLPQPNWKRIKTQCAGKIASLVELLQARLSAGVMEVVTKRGEGLFPKPAEIQMRCSCPDWAGMCKHVAAVMYGIGARLDDQPELLFLLREIDHLELIAAAVESAPVANANTTAGKKTIAADDLADVFGIEMADTGPLVKIPKPPVPKLRKLRTDASTAPRTEPFKTIEVKSAKSRTTALAAGSRRKAAKVTSGSKQPMVAKAKKATSHKKTKTAAARTVRTPAPHSKAVSKTR
jgi:uncharacterized Zn finger protein